MVLAILSAALLLGMPAIQNLIVRSRTEGFAREASVLMQRTRLEAIKMNREGVVHLDPVNRRLVAFIDADRDGTFNPDPDEPPRTTDYVLGRLPLPENVDFVEPGGLRGKDSIDGFTAIEAGDDLGEVQAAYFQPDGSVADAGAFRVGDVRENFLEIRVDSPASGRIELRKWQTMAAAGVAKDDWYGSGDPGDEGFVPWKWN